jgi:hypothetical protein
MRAADKVVAITCIAIACWKNSKWFDGVVEIPILRGQFVRSWAGLSNDSGETIQTVRTSVQHLEKVGFLTRKPTGRYHVFTIPKYSHYQDLTKYSDQIAAESNRIPNSPLTGTQQAANNIQEGNKGIREEEGAPAPRHPSETIDCLEDVLNRAVGSNGQNLPSSPIGLLMAKARAAKIPGKAETLRSYIEAWVARSNYTKVEQILTDPWSRGKTVIEIQDHFFPKGNDGMTDREFAERRDSGYRKV